VLTGLGWISAEKLDDWRFGRVNYLERTVTANLSKISFAMLEFRRWAVLSKLKPSETVYKRYGKGPKIILRFSKSGSPAIEKAYRTHYVLQRLAAANDAKMPLNEANTEASILEPVV
jgi:hypothetical protein